MSRRSGPLARAASITALLVSATLAPPRASPLAAQEVARVFLGGGLSTVAGELAQTLKSGYHAGLGVAVTVGRLPIQIRVDGRFHRISGDESVIGPGRDLQIVSGTVGGLASLKDASRFRPYLSGGVGLYLLQEVGDSALPGSDPRFGLHAGAGLDYRLTRGLGLFVEGRFEDVFTTGRNILLLPISAGLSLGR